MAALLPANPGEALWIGGTAGKNHGNVGIGQGSSGGTNHEDYGQDLIEEGFTQASRFELNATGNAVFTINAGAGRTSTNTQHPRCECRELTASGALAAWDGRSGVHYMKGRCRIIDVTTNRPWVCFAQIHGSSSSPNTSDLIRLQTEGDTGTSTNLSIIARRTPPGGSEIRTVIATGYDVNDWINYELGMYDGRLKVFLDGVAVLDVTGMGQIGDYFKWGCYLQDNVEKGASASDTAAVEYERGSSVIWHTGYPNPTLPVFTGASDPEGGPGGGDGGADTQPPTVPQDLVSLQDDTAITLIWSPSTDNVGVDHYNVYRFSDTGTGGGVGGTATVGKTTGGASSTSSSTDKMIASAAIADTDGTLTTGFFRAFVTSGTTTSKMFVYADSSGAPGALLATSDQITIDDLAETIQQYSFTGAAQISITSGTTYWLAAAWDDPGAGSITYSRDGTSSKRYEQTLTYPTAPSPFGTPTGSFTGPIDAWIETVSSGTGGGTNTTLGKLTDGAATSVSTVDKAAASSVTASGSGTLTSGVSRVWLSSSGSAGTRMVVYADTAGAPGNAVAVSDEVTITATAEAAHTYTFTGASQIAIANGTTYWVGLAWRDPGTPQLTFSRDSTASGLVVTGTFTYPPTVGGAFGTPSASLGPIDAYVNVTATAGYVLLATTTNATYHDTGLTNGTEYTYVVSASDAAGNSSAQSLPVSDTPGPPDITAPSVPAGLDAAAGDRKVSLSWTASTDADSGVDHYDVYRDTVLLAETVDETPSFVDRTVANGTLYSYKVSAVDVAGNESAQSSADTATPAAPVIAGVPYLTHELGADAKLGVEIAWGAELGNDADSWTWTDITDDVRHDPGIAISLGRNDESSTSNPASLSLVLDNLAGDYSLGGHSANWPNVRRNTPVRVRVDPDDNAGGRVLFFGFADGFTPGWAAHNVPAVTLSASGTLRRLAQGDAPVQSTYRRVMTATSSVQAYWPFEEKGKDAEYAPAVRGAADMTITQLTGFRGGPTGFGDPSWASDDSFSCSEPLPLLQTGAFSAKVYPYPDTGTQQIRFLMSVPEDGLPDGTTICHIHTAGGVRWGLTYEINTLGESALGIFRMVNGVEHSNTIVGFEVNGRSGRLSLELTTSGSNVDWTLDYLDANADRGVAEVDDITAFAWRETLTGVTGGIVTFIEVNPHGHIGDMGFGHLTVEDEINSLFTDSKALFAYRREYAVSLTAGASRLSRLCIENDVPLTVYGNAAPDAFLRDSDKMGSQLVAPLLELLHQAEEVDLGQLWDGRDAGLSYTNRRRREDGVVALTIDASASQLAAELGAVDDDQRTRNRVMVTRSLGTTASAEDVDGPHGIDAIGIYDTAYTVNCHLEAMTLQHAQWAVHLGTVEGYRYPTVTINLRKSPTLAPEVLDVVLGERIDVVNLDDALSQFPGGTVSLIVEGISHQLSATSWLVTFRCSPFSPWGVGRVAEETGDTSDMLARLDTDGATLNSSAVAGATSISVATAAGAALWTTAADNYPLDLSVGGLYVHATACSGASSPQTFTVGALTHARTSGVEVKLWDPRPVGMG